ncbi:protocatechuate 3,4-dioxygenase subunit alpha [Tateyamaria omphalii]|uniref:Protocatechuate 3,4-dioxygenase subunit alpha n=1 Tax=Tateyamaria omphalii TaxID=299262 RepID=A0A1P8MZN9_9RHOB|nr:protocatechuate 3,4-dioxygenase subunit alpha [Tateyamaria omphalii]APX13468.1 protocatechuate 3,4-dioxygenase subunit alpha [Tateyamaria omphalii]
MPAQQLKESPSQTAGPYVHIGCTPNFAGVTGVYANDPGATMITDTVEGQRVTITGTVFDGQGAPLTDALVEIWQADATGRFGATNSGFTGWGRCPADQSTGQWRFDTIRPGPTGAGAAHITFWIVARGINVGLHTRMYFPDDPLLASDPWLSIVEDVRRDTLIAKGSADGQFHFDIHLQGRNETVFFDA